MKNRTIIIIIIGLILFTISDRCYSQVINVVFLNPGSAKDVGVWHMVSNFMKAAADDLDIKLEIIYADRNHIKMIDQAEEVSKRNNLPDYILMVNERRAGKQMLSYFSKSKSKIVFIHNGLSDQQKDEIGSERNPIANWIGTITTDEYLAGNKLIKELYRYSNSDPKIIGITGTESTPVSLIRLQGVKDYISEGKKGRHHQVVYGEWSYEDGKEKTLYLLRRYKDTDIIWAANDSMALGAYDATKELGYNNSIAVGGLGGFPFALESIRKSEMKLTVAGHPMIGAWALIIIHDYHKGIDFQNDIGTNYKVDHLTVIDSPQKADQYEQLVLVNPQQINFRKFSKVLNSEVKKYSFQYDKLIQFAK